MKPLKLDIGSPAFKAQPIHEVRRLQSYGDLVPIHFPFMGKMLATTRAELTEHVLTRSDLFVSEPKNAGKPGASMVPAWMPQSVKDLADNMVVKDDPDHKRLRSLVDKAFAKRSVLDLGPTFDNIAQELVNDLDATLALDGQTDFISVVAKQMPIVAMISMLGLPSEDRQQFTGWASRFANLNGLWEFWLITRAIKQMRDYVATLVETRRVGDPNGLVASLIEAEEAGDKLTRDELTTTLVVLMSAGFETTTHLINGGLWILSERPDLRATLRKHPDKMSAFLHECLRWVSPFVSTKPRLSAVDQELAGVSIKQGEFVLPLIICSNYDDRLFEQPDHFDLERSNANRHLSFGRGIHNCLGRLIARAQAQAVFEALLARPEPFYQVETPVWAKRPGSRNMKHLIIRESAR